MSGIGSERLDFVVEQVWGRGIENGELLAVMTGAVPDGWTVRERYWVVPTAGAAKLLVPSDRRVAARALADFAGLRGPKVRLARRALAAAVSAGVPLSRDVLRIVAPPSAPLSTVAEIGARIGQPRVFATFGVRMAANAKPTLELRTADGDAVGFVKLSWNPVTEEAIRNEAFAMKQLAADSRVEVRAPAVLADGMIGERRFVMVEPLPRGITHVPRAFSALSDAEALGPGSVVRRGGLADADQVRDIRAGLRAQTTASPENLVTQVRDLAERIGAADVEVPIANFWHGDFVWWNAGRDQQGQLWLFDWETAQRDAPAGMDTLHWFSHTVDAENPHSVVARVDAALAHCAPLLRRLGHSRAGVATLAAWYAVTLVANEIRLAESLQGWARIKHPPAVLEGLLAWGARKLEAG